MAESKIKCCLRRVRHEDSSVDYSTFKTSWNCSCFAKDKKSYYFWGEKLEVTEETDDETLRIIAEPDKL